MTNRRRWTDDELGFIQGHDDWSLERIADELGRSVESVRVKRVRVRAGWTPTQNVWSAIEDDFLIANPRMSAPAVAAHLTRTVIAIKQRRIFLAKRGDTSFGFGKKWAPSRVGARPLLAKTCPNCGLLLQAMWFTKNRIGRAKICTRCSHLCRKTKQATTSKGRSQQKEFMDKCQALTLPSASQSGQPWTESDFHVLADPDMTIFQKALKLHRTYRATGKACSKNGFKSHVGLGDPERDQWIIDNPNAKRIQDITEAPKYPELVSAGRPGFEWDD